MNQVMSSTIKFVGKHLGIAIATVLILVILDRGMNPMSQTVAFGTIVSLCVPMVFLGLREMYSHRPGWLSRRVNKADVLFSIFSIIVYVGITSGLLNEFN